MCSPAVRKLLCPRTEFLSPTTWVYWSPPCAWVGLFVVTHGAWMALWYSVSLTPASEEDWHQLSSLRKWRSGGAGREIICTALHKKRMMKQEWEPTLPACCPVPSPARGQCAATLGRAATSSSFCTLTSVFSGSATAWASPYPRTTYIYLWRQGLAWPR